MTLPAASVASTTTSELSKEGEEGEEMTEENSKSTHPSIPGATTTTNVMKQTSPCWIFMLQVLATICFLLSLFLIGPFCILVAILGKASMGLPLWKEYSEHAVEVQGKVIKCVLLELQYVSDEAEEYKILTIQYVAPETNGLIYQIHHKIFYNLSTCPSSGDSYCLLAMPGYPRSSKPATFIEEQRRLAQSEDSKDWCFRFIFLLAGIFYAGLFLFWSILWGLYYLLENPPIYFGSFGIIGRGYSCRLSFG
jgi:hypothetical protein